MTEHVQDLSVLRKHGATDPLSPNDWVARCVGSRELPAKAPECKAHGHRENLMDGNLCELAQVTVFKVGETNAKAVGCHAK